MSVCAGPWASNSAASGRICKYSRQSVRALPTRIITVGKTRSKGIKLLVDEYSEKMEPYCDFEDVQIRSNPKNARDVKAQIKDEDLAVMSHIKPDDWVVMLDERGIDMRSEQLAELIGDAGNTVWNNIFSRIFFFPSLTQAWYGSVPALKSMTWDILHHATFVFCCAD